MAATKASQAKVCETCGDEMEAGQRRVRCPYCNKLVCGWCFNHVHGPGSEELETGRPCPNCGTSMVIDGDDEEQYYECQKCFHTEKL